MKIDSPLYYILNEIFFTRVCKSEIVTYEAYEYERLYEPNES